MKIIATLHLIFSLFTFLILSCNDQTSKLTDNRTGGTDTFIRDIPLYRNGKQIAAYAISRQLEKKLVLPDISSGFDSIQLRICFTYSFKDSAQMIVLKYQDDKWNAKIYSYLFGNNDSINKNTPVNISSTYPSSGWDTFISKIYGLGILTLPDMDKVNNGRFEIYEGDAVTVEYATRNKYRLYQYNTPYEFQKIWTEAKQMEDIIQLVEKEFNFKRLRFPTGKPLEKN